MTGPAHDAVDQDPRVARQDSWKVKAHLARTFSAASETYDMVGSPTFRHLGALLVDQVGVRPGDRVLDVACGRGATVVPAAEATGPSGEVVGVDIARGMVAALTATLDAAGTTNARAQLADAEALPFEDGAFDVVLCGFALFFFPDTHQALRECRRVLRPGGRLGVSTFTPALHEWLAWFNELARQALGLPADYGPVAGSKFDVAAELYELLSTGGFGDIAVEESPCQIVLGSPEEFWAWTWSAGLRALLESMDTGQRQRVKVAAFERLAGLPGAPLIRIPADALLVRATKAENSAHLVANRAESGRP